MFMALLGLPGGLGANRGSPHALASEVSPGVSCASDGLEVARTGGRLPHPLGALLIRPNAFHIHDGADHGDAMIGISGLMANISFITGTTSFMS